MTAYLRSPLVLVWLVLSAVTLASWRVGATDASHVLSIDLPITATVVAFVLIKSRLVFWYFMEVRHAAAWLRWSCDAWSLFLAIMVVALYAQSL